MYKIIFIDIDGTLRKDNKEITQRTKNAIKNAVDNGIYVVICSGRYRKYTELVSKDALASNYIIACNGGDVYDYEKQKIIYENSIDEDTIMELYKLAEKYKVEFIMNCRDERIIKKLNSNLTDNQDKNIDELIKTHIATQCIFYDEDIKKIKAIKEEMNKIKEAEIINSSKSLVNDKEPVESSFFLDVARKRTSKGEGIKQLCKYLNIDLEDSVALGDSYNDLTMFKVVGHSVAMGNAPDDIKELVDEVTDTNEEDGVAKFLERLNAGGNI